MTQQLKKVLFVTEDAPDLAKMAEGLLSRPGWMVNPLYSATRLILLFWGLRLF